MAHELGEQVLAVTASVEVLVYWRPGCRYCTDLRSQLEKAGIAYRPVDIWQDPAAAARERSIADGNETVPTVVIGEHALVNPNVGDVRAALGQFGGYRRSAPWSVGGGRWNEVFGRSARRDQRPPLS